MSVSKRKGERQSDVEKGLRGCVRGPAGIIKCVSTNLRAPWTAGTKAREGRGNSSVSQRVTLRGATPPALSRIRETSAAPLLPDLEQRLRPGPEIAQEAGRRNSPWFPLGSSASTGSAVHPTPPALRLYHKATRPPPACTNRPDTGAPGNTAVAAVN